MSGWQAWLHPWMLFSFFFPICQILFYTVYQKRELGERLQSPVPLIGKTFLLGGAVGFILSISSLYFPFEIVMEEVQIVLWIALFTSCFGFRFLCFSHAIGFVGFIHLLVNQWDRFHHWLNSYSMGKTILQFSVTDWLWIVAILHLGEWLLIRINGCEGRQLVTEVHHTGKKVNGFVLNRIWPIPCVFLTSTGWIPVPLIAGFVSYNLSKPLQQQQRLSSTLSLMHTLFLVIILMIAPFFSYSLWLGVIWSLVGHELLFRIQRWKEKRLPPLYISDELGLKVLEVLPKSPAAQLGIRPGFILQQANGVAIRSIQDLIQIIRRSAHCKLKLLDGQFDHHFVQKAIYEDDPKHLGIIGAISVSEVAATKEKIEHEEKEEETSVCPKTN